MNNIKIAILNNKKSFLPEARAYKKFLISCGYYAQIVEPDEYCSKDYLVTILFHGFHPFWRCYSEIVIGEYHSLSTGSFPKIKNLIKRVINKKSDIYIFLNKDVRRGYYFLEKSKNSIYRPMGYPGEIISECRSENKIYDIIYAGSLRDGVINVIVDLAKMGFKLAVVGNKIEYICENVDFFGVLDQRQVFQLIGKSKFGLNYTPDIYPYNIQDSTKIIEYSAMGLGVITNKYYWVDRFENERGCKFIDIKKIENFNSIHHLSFKVPDVSDLCWDILLRNSNLIKMIEDKIEANNATSK